MKTPRHERRSLRKAIRHYGPRRVAAAHQALAQGLRDSDIETWRVYYHAMFSGDPYEVILRWRYGTALRRRT